MASRQDQLHSYQLMTQRMASALMMADSDPDRPPLRGAAGAVLAGVLVTAIVLGGVVAWGLFSGPVSEDWRQPDVLVVEEGSGARYVWRDDALHPVGSYSSALLVLGEAAPRTVAVVSTALDGVPRGAALGIPGAPDSLPAADRLVTDPWAVCSTAGDGEPASVLLAGGGPSGTAVPPDHGVLVQVPDGARYLIWQQQRLRFRDDEITIPALGWAGRAPLPVAPALIEAIPAGPDLARIQVPGAGQASAAVAGAVVGEVFVVTGQAGAPQYAIALPDGLAPATAVQVDLVLSDPAVAAVVGQREPRPLPQAEFAALPRLAPAALDGAGLPPVAPALAERAQAALCVLVSGEESTAGVYLDPQLPPLAQMVRTAGRTADGDLLADRILVAPGSGVIVSSGRSVSLVTDLGVRYPLTPDALAPLGYSAVPPVPLPPAVVSLIPAGPTLDPATARSPSEPG